MVHVFYFYFLHYLAVPLFHFKLATTMCGSTPPPPPPARVNIYFAPLQLAALLCFTGRRGGGGPHILGLLGVIHTFINGKTTLRNLCFPSILCLNISQSDSNSLKIIIRLHCLRLYIQYLVQWKHIVTSSVDSIF